MEGLSASSGAYSVSAPTGTNEVKPLEQGAQESIDVSGENIAAMPAPEMRMMPPSTESGKAVFTENGANKTALDVDSDGQADTVLTEFKDGSSAVMQDSNKDGKADLMKEWNANGEVTMSANDQNFDGSIDRMYTAEDTNHDSKLDTGTLSTDDDFDGIMDSVGTGEEFLETGATDSKEGFVDVSGENIAAEAAPDMRQMPTGEGVQTFQSGKNTVSVFQEKGNTKIAIDKDGDKQADEVFTAFQDGSKAVMRDQNNDGKSDFMKEWSADGEVIMKARDRNFDGNIDRVYTAEDTNHDNKVDTATLSFDDNFDGVMDRVGDGEAILQAETSNPGNPGTPVINPKPTPLGTPVINGKPAPVGDALLETVDASTVDAPTVDASTNSQPTK